MGYFTIRVRDSQLPERSRLYKLHIDNFAAARRLLFGC